MTRTVVRGPWSVAGEECVASRDRVEACVVSPLGPQPQETTPRAPTQDGGGADFCVRSAGHPSENPRPTGQPDHLHRP